MGTSIADLFGQTPAPRPARSIADLFAEDALTAGRQDAARLRATINGVQHSPEQGAEALTLARRTGVPADVALRNLDPLRQMASVEEFDADTFVRENPVTARWLTGDPIRPVVARDDFESLTGLERVTGRGTVADRFLQAFGNIGRAPSAQVDFTQRPTNVQRGTVAAAMSSGFAGMELAQLYGTTTPAERRNPEMQARIAAAKAREIALPQSESVLESSLRSFMGGFVPSMTVVATEAAQGAVAGAAGGAVLGGLSPVSGVTAGLGATVGAKVAGYNAYRVLMAGEIARRLEDVRDENGVALSDGTQFAVSQATGAGLALLGMYGFDVALGVLNRGAANIAGKVIADGVGRALTPRTAARVAGEVAKVYAGTVAVETAQETLEQAGIIASESIARAIGNVQGGDFAPVDNVVAELGATMVETALGALWLGGVGGVSAGAVGLARMEKAQADADQMAAEVGLAEQSKLRERDPETFQSLAVEVLKQSGNEYAYADPERLQAVLAENNVSVEQLAATLRVPVEELRVPMTAGTAVRLPRANILTYLAKTELMPALQRELSLDPSVPSPAMAEEMARDWEQNADEIRRQMAEAQTAALDDAGERIVEDVKLRILAAAEQLPRQAEYTPENVEQIARVTAAFYAVAAKRAGQDAWSLYQRKRARVVGPELGVPLYNAITALNDAIDRNAPADEIAPLRTEVERLAGGPAQAALAQEAFRNGDPVTAQERADFLAQEQTAEPRLQALHNLTEANLAFAAQMGGLAVPSLGVTKEGMSYATMGEVTLIGTRAMADPAETPVFTADAYTVTFPRPEYKKAKSKDALALYRKFEPDARRFEDSVANEVSDNASAGRPDRSIELMIRSPAAIATFLREQGETLEPVLYPERRQYQNVDWSASRAAALAAIAGREAEYKAWVERQVLPMHGEPFLKLGRKSVPYTLENIVKVMQGKGQAVEKTMTFGTGKARAASAKRIKDLEDLRRRSYAIGTTEQVEIGRKEAEELLGQYRNAVIEYHSGTDTWEALDSSMRAIARFAKGTNIGEALRREGFREVPQEILDLGKRAGQAMLDTPVPYFEAKVQRAVRLTEFAGAVIPSDASEQTRTILADAGIAVAEYERNNDQSRNEAITQLNQRLSAQGVDVLFQGGARPNAILLNAGLSPRTIALLPTANLSSALHELAHDFLFTIQDLGTAPDATPESQAFLAETRKALGLADGEPISEAAQETFARGFERYAMEGKSPSRALARAFYRFIQWFNKIYEDVKDSPLVPISDELRSVFDRMLATEEEIAEAKARQSGEPMFTEADAEKLGTTPDELQGYAKAVLYRTSEESAKLLKAVMEDMRKEGTEQWQAEAAKVRAEVRAELERDPIYRAFTFLHDTVENGQRVKLNREAFDAEYGVEFGKQMARLRPGIWSTSERAPFAKREGTDAEGITTIGTNADAIALAYGFRDGQAFVEALQAMVSLEDAVEQRTRREMQARFPDLEPFSQAIADEADRVTHLENTDDVLVRELNLLGKSAGIRPPSVATVKRVAREMLGRETVRNIKPQVYANAEATAGRKAGEAWRKGDAQQAMAYKRQQLLNHILFREATAALEQVEVIRKFMRRMEGESAQARMGKVSVGQTRPVQQLMNDLLDRFNFRAVGKAESARMESAAVLFEAFVAEREAEGSPVVITPAVKNAMARPYQEVPYSLLLDVYETAKMLWHDASEMDKERVGAERRTFEERKAQLLESIAKNNPQSLANRKFNQRPRFWEPKGTADLAATSLNALLLPPENVFDILDGGKPGIATQLTMDKANAAADELMRKLDILGNAVQDAMKDAIPKDRLKSYMYAAVVVDGVSGPNGPVGRITGWDIFALALNYGNQSSRDAVNAGTVNGIRPYTDANVQKLLATLTDAELDAVQKVWDAVSMFWSEVSELEQRMTGIAPNKVEATPLTVIRPDGTSKTIAGGYYPLKYDPTNSDLALRRMFDTIKDGILGAESVSFSAQASTRRGHLQERQKANGALVELGMHVLGNHVVTMLHDLTHRAALYDIKKILLDREVIAAVEGVFGKGIYEASIKPWMLRLANSNQGPTNSFEKMMLHARAGVTIGTLAMKFSTTLMQTLGVFQSIEVLGGVSEGTKWFGRGMLEFRHRGLKSIKDAIALSGEMKSRVEGNDVNLRELADEMQKDGTFSDKTRLLMLSITYADAIVSSATFWGGYYKHLATNPTDTQGAVDAGSRAVRMSQGASRAKDLSTIASGGPLSKLITSFYTNGRTLYGLYARRYFLTKQGKSGVSEFLGTLFLLNLLPAVLEPLMTGRGPDEDEDWVTKAAWWAWNIGTYPAQVAPILRDYVRALEPGKPFPPEFTVPAFRAITAPMQAGKVLVDKTLDAIIGNDDPWSKSDIKPFVETTGYWLKLPTLQPWLTGNAVWQWLQGYDTTPMEFLRGPQR